jgi:hypothetical protein
MGRPGSAELCGMWRCCACEPASFWRNAKKKKQRGTLRECVGLAATLIALERNVQRPGRGCRGAGHGAAATEAQQRKRVTGSHTQREDGAAYKRGTMLDYRRDSVATYATFTVQYIHMFDGWLRLGSVALPEAQS